MSTVTPGQVLHGRYRLLEAIASGGFGRVWKANDETLRTDVAIKEMVLPPISGDLEREERKKRAEREARNAAKLRGCPNVVTVHDVFIEDDRPWVVMQLIDGRSLAQLLESGAILTSSRARELAEHVLEALKAAHAAGIVHRDVKPGNVLLANDGQVLLTDFGASVHREDTTLTQPGMLVASMEFIAPERLGGGDELPAGDMFSLGVTLYQATEGVSPFRRGTLQATVAAILHHDPPRPEHADDDLGELIEALLDKDPDERPTAAEALAALRDLPDPRTRVLEEADDDEDYSPPVSVKTPVVSTTSGTTAKSSSGGTAAFWIIACIVAFVVFGLFWGQTPTDAQAGDCVWDSSGIPGDDGNWSQQPCAMPVPGATNYKIVHKYDYVTNCPEVGSYTRLQIPKDAPRATLCLTPVVESTSSQ